MSLTTAVVVAAYRRRTLLLAAVLIVLGVAAVGVQRVSFDTDVLSLLPHDGRVTPAFRQYLRSFGSVDQLYVVFTAPVDHSVSEYEDVIAEWIDHLREAPEIAEVDAGRIGPTQNVAWLADRALLLLDDAALKNALDRMTSEGMMAAVADRREFLTLPSREIVEMVRHDPAGLSELVRLSLGPSVPGLSTPAQAGGYVSADGRSRLVIARPAEPPYDATVAHALDARLRNIDASVSNRQAPGDLDEQLPRLQIEYAGGHRIALETESLIRREATLNTVASLALILPLLFVVFRSVWLVLVGALPSALSLLVALGVLGFTGATLAAAAAGSAAMLFGLGVDGVVLLYVAHRIALEEATDSAALPYALAGPATSMLLGMWTTAATFYGLTFVDFPSLQQLGLLIGHAMAICGVLTLVLVPALLPRKRSHISGRRLTMPRLAGWLARRRRAVLAAAVLATAVLGLASTRLEVNPTLDRLRSTTAAARLEERLVGMFGLPRDVYVVLAERDDIEPLLEVNERLRAAVALELPDLRIMAPSQLLPSRSVREKRARTILAAGLSPNAVRASVEDAGAAAGFRAGVFQPFIDRLPNLLDAHAELSYETYHENGFSDLIGRLVVRDGSMWRTATYVFPETPEDVAALERIVAATDPAQTLTGLPLVNGEMAQRFLPQFVRGLIIGTFIVVALVVLAFRRLSLSLYALAPTVLGLVWAAGLLAIVGVELDLFALFAVVTFIGVGVDYGVHLVYRFQERGDAERAVAELAPVILVAAVITLLGYGTLLGSSFPPLQSIGTVSAVSVVALAAAAVLVVPALLMGRR